MNPCVLAVETVYQTEKNTMKDTWKMEYTEEVVDWQRQTQQKGEIALYQVSSAGLWS